MSELPQGGLARVAALSRALRRAQAYNEVLTRHVAALITTVEKKGVPNAPTLIKACELMLKKAFQAAEEIE